MSKENAAEVPPEAGGKGSKRIPKADREQDGEEARLKADGEQAEEVKEKRKPHGPGERASRDRNGEGPSAGSVVDGKVGLKSGGLGGVTMGGGRVGGGPTFAGGAPVEGVLAIDFGVSITRTGGVVFQAGRGVLERFWRPLPGARVKACFLGLGFPLGGRPALVPGEDSCFFFSGQSRAQWPGLPQCKQVSVDLALPSVGEFWSKA